MREDERHLAEADEHIAEAERRITAQERRLWIADAAGHDTTEGRRLLANLRATLDQLHLHRRMILDRINQAQPLGRPQ